MSLTDEEFQPKPVKDSSGQEHEPDVIAIGPPESWKVVQRPCSDGHDMESDPTETDFEAERCRRCGFGRLLRAKGTSAL